MSPEQAVDEEVDARSDIFALGIMLFEAVTGRRLFKGKNQFITLKRLLGADPPPIGKLRRDVPDRLQEILDKALAKSPDDRYDRAADMQHDLERLIAKSGKVVNAAHLAELMQHLFAESAYAPPELDTSEAITERFAALEEADAPAEEPAPMQLAPPPRAAPTRGGLPVALLVGGGAAAAALLALLVGLALWPDDPAPSPSASPPREVPSAPEPDPVDVDPRDPPPTEPVAEAGPEPPPTEVESPPTEATDVADPPEDTESAPEEQTSTRRRGRRRGRGRRGRGTGGEGGGTVIVSDPGF